MVYDNDSYLIRSQFIITCMVVQVPIYVFLSEMTLFIQCEYVTVLLVCQRDKLVQTDQTVLYIISRAKKILLVISICLVRANNTKALFKMEPI